MEQLILIVLNIRLQLFGSFKPGFLSTMEVDSSIAEVSLIPPLGISHVVYVVLAITSVVVFGGGIVLIKKYVMKKG